MPTFLAIEIGGSKLQICAGSGAGEILERHRFVVDRERGGEGIRDRIAATLPGLIEQWKPAAIGVGYGGPVKWRTGQISRSYHIVDWSDFPLGEWLRGRTGIPAFVENDANVAALGEAVCGAGVGCDPVFYTTLGSGVGGGLVSEGRIYHGASPSEMEFGHMRLHGPPGILEDQCSGWSVDREIRAAIVQAPGSVLAVLVLASPGAEARHLPAALAASDPVALTILDTLASNVAEALGVVTQLLHPEVIVIGGGLSLIGEPLRAAVERNLPAYIMDVFQPGPRILLAGLKEDSVPVGALVLAGMRSGADFGAPHYPGG